MNEVSLVYKLAEKGVDLYEKTYFYFFAFYGAALTFIGKDYITGEESIISTFSTPGSIGSYFVIAGSAFFVCVILWYVYISMFILSLNIIVAKRDPLYAEFLKDRHRVTSTIIFVIISHIVFFVPPYIILAYYAVKSNSGWTTAFNWVLWPVLLIYLFAFFYRIFAIIVISRKIAKLPAVRLGSDQGNKQ